MGERRRTLPTGIELPVRQRQVDQILSQDFVRDEFYDTRRKAAQSRTSSRDEILNKPPRFRFISEYHAAVYDPKQGNVFEGKWSDLHYWIAREHEIAQPEDSWNNIQRYVSADVFTLRAARGTKVMIIDTLYGLKGNDLATIEERGYFVMSPYHNWLLRNSSSQDGFIEVPSVLSQ